MSLSPYRAAQPLGDMNLVGQAAKNCNYFGRFVYKNSYLGVERTDPVNRPWSSKILNTLRVNFYPRVIRRSW